MSHPFDLLGWFDGSCSPQPGGIGGWGVVLRDNQKQLCKLSGTLPDGPDMTNNVAEFHACANLLELIGDLAMKDWRVLVQGDSRLVISKMTAILRNKRSRKERGKYVPEYLRARKNLFDLKHKGVIVHFQWIGREFNSEADRLSVAHR
ncbi:MAG: ribonuclease HI family protein [Candidatus Omnitrophica bacterium]|nr:ribonuclease HI family protein [Candidatus Omnitrophota bacterium]MDE2215382.1 ribonuclease HI family protein [Candidatus Omnitrophota bacterium]